MLLFNRKYFISSLVPSQANYSSTIAFLMDLVVIVVYSVRNSHFDFVYIFLI